jgi:hypothetical protein
MTADFPGHFHFLYFYSNPSPVKKYYSLGELLVDYRHLNKQTQADLAAMLNVDVRTIARWEKNESLINPDKEADVVEHTFIPYQVIHNLNAPVPLPMYYDFRIRKYSLTEIEQEMPDANWLRERMDAVSERIRPINTDAEVEQVIRYHSFLYPTEKTINKPLLKQAVRMLPQLNYILYDTAGFYAGHHVVFPLSIATFQRLKNREIVEGDLRDTDLKNFKTVKPPVLYAYSVYADCNENFYYLLAVFIRFMRELNEENYIYGGLMVRHDAAEIVEQIGLKKIWEDQKEQKELGMLSPPTFLEGKFNKVLLGY